MVKKSVDLLQLNKQDKIWVGSNSLIKTHNQESTTATVFGIGKRLGKRVKIEVIIFHFLGSMDQCVDESNIIATQRDYKQGSDIDECDPSLEIRTPLPKITPKKFDFTTGNHLGAMNSGTFIDDMEVDVNMIPPRTSPTIEITSSRSVLINRKQNTTSVTSIVSPKSMSSSINENVSKISSNPQSDVNDAISRLASKLQEITNDRD